MVVFKTAWWLFFVAHLVALSYGDSVWQVVTVAALAPLLLSAFWKKGLKAQPRMIVAMGLVWIGDFLLVIGGQELQEVAILGYFGMHLLYATYFIQDVQSQKAFRLPIGGLLVWVSMMGVLIVGGNICLDGMPLYLHALVVLYGILVVTNFNMSLYVSLHRESMAFYLQMVGYFMILLSDMYYATSLFCGELPYTMLLGALLNFPGQYLLVQHRLQIQGMND